MSSVLRNSRSLAGMATNSVSRWSLRQQKFWGWFRGLWRFRGLAISSHQISFGMLKTRDSPTQRSWNIHQQQSTRMTSSHTYLGESSVWLLWFLLLLPPQKNKTSSSSSPLFGMTWISSENSVGTDRNSSCQVMYPKDKTSFRAAGGVGKLMRGWNDGGSPSLTQMAIASCQV